MAFTLAQPLYGQTGSYTAQQDRLHLQGFAATSGVDTMPTATTGDLAVTTSGSANASVSIAAGHVWVPGSSGQGFYYAYNDAAVALTLTANASGSTRNDLIYVLVSDPNISTGLPNVQIATIVGTPGGGVPSLPSSNAVPLASVAVPTGFTSGSTVAASSITDRRTKALLNSTAVPSTTTIYVPSPVTGQLAFDTGAGTLKVYDGAGWRVQTLSGTNNKIINGDFSINQRAFSSTTTTETYGFDRWVMAKSGGTVTYSAQTFTAGNPISSYEPRNYARVVTSGQSAAGDYGLLAQRIESVRTFSGQTVTVSFWARAASGTPKVAVDLEQHFGTGGSPSANVNTYAGQVTLSTTWTRYSVTVAVPSISGKTLGTSGTDYFGVLLWVSAGSTFNTRTGTLGIQSATFEFWGVQAEEGTSATPFYPNPVDVELVRCQRYYWRSKGTSIYSVHGYGLAQTTTIANILVPLPVTLQRTTAVLETSNVQVSDGTSGYSSGTFALFTNSTTPDSLQIQYTHGTAVLTQFRPMRIENANNAAGYVACSTEL